MNGSLRCLVTTGLLLAPICAAGAADLLCRRGEQLIFGCTIENSGKLLSICASPGLSAGAGWLQYRYGKPGQVELAFPAGRSNTQASFRRSRYLRPRVIYEELYFSNGGFRYTVFDHYNAEGEAEGEPAQFARGVTVVAEKVGKEPSYLNCIEPAQGRLDTLEDVVPTVEYYEPED